MKNIIPVILGVLLNCIVVNIAFGQNAPIVKKKYTIKVVVTDGRLTNDSTISSIQEFDKNKKEISYANLDDKAEVENLYKISYRDTTPVLKEYFELKNGNLQSTGKTEYWIRYNAQGKKEKEERIAETCSTLITYAYSDKGLLISETEQQSGKENTTVLVYKYSYDKENRMLSKILVSTVDKDSLAKKSGLITLSNTAVWEKGVLKEIRYETQSLSANPNMELTRIEYSGGKIKNKIVYFNDQMTHKISFRYYKNGYIATNYSYEHGTITEHSVIEYKDDRIMKIETHDKNGKLITLQVYKYEFY
ncbi:MAG: hypothetical protein JWP12_3238 [Bacteroidetes bacterium]|nr:hypothetical protein [Bacteroidota bacterium]